MKFSTRARAVTAALLVGAFGLAGPGSSAAAAPAARAAAAPAAEAATDSAIPHLSFAITKAGVIKLVDAPKHLTPGRVAFEVTSNAREAALGFVRFHRGYSFQDFGADMGKVFGQNDMKAMKRVIANATFLGGAGVDKGMTTTGTVVLPRAGTYTLFNTGAAQGGAGRNGPATIEVSGERRAAAVPIVDGTIKALSGIQWGGDTTLPAQGTLKFRNAATDSPHFLEVVHVADGTTKQDIMDYFESGSEEPPSWALPESIFAEVVNPKHGMTLDYDLPAGSYAIMCFFPDVEMDGMPHAMMGMVEVITLQ